MSHGLTVTFTGGLVQEFRGTSALANALAFADERGLRVCTFSTPRTIARDLRGPRAETPEARVLRLVGRSDLHEGGTT
jgi:hypothetical protein